MKTLTVFQKTVRTDSNGRYCLNDLHKAAMAQGLATESHKPVKFLRNANVKAFIQALDLEGQNSPSIETLKGRGITGTYATELVALRYAGWISPAAEVEVYRTFQKVRNADEDLTASMIERQSDSEASKRLAARAQGKVARNEFTDTLKIHGVTGKGYPACTNALYVPLFGANAADIRKQRALPKRANIRESMSFEELTATMFAEMVAIKRIREREAKGNHECYKHTLDAAKETKAVVDRKDEE